MVRIEPSASISIKLGAILARSSLLSSRIKFVLFFDMNSSVHIVFETLVVLLESLV